jgi:DNA sulfur modification protein DndC
MINTAKETIRNAYLDPNTKNKPWIIGFSGGKDSTAMLTLIWEVMLDLKHNDQDLNRKVYVVSNDTMVENPIIVEYLHFVLDEIDRAAASQDLPITVNKTSPNLDESFWVNVIGRGYPVPNNTFRWCTDKLKIKPTSSFLDNAVEAYGEAIILIGSRKEESSQRAKTINKYKKKNSVYSSHATNSRALVFTPISELHVGDIWGILAGPAPWSNKSNIRLREIYGQAESDEYECPTVVTSDSHKSCGQSRFGCWVCTVVKEDKSMRAMIKNSEDYEWMTPLFDFRNELIRDRNDIQNRMSTRRNGQKAHNGMGPYTSKYRSYLLEKLLRIQKVIQQTKPYVDLISSQELVLINSIWVRDSIFEKSTMDIYYSVYKKKMKDPLITHKQLDMMSKTFDYSTLKFLKKAIELEKSSLFSTKTALSEDIYSIIENEQ